MKIVQPKILTRAISLLVFACINTTAYATSVIHCPSAESVSQLDWIEAKDWNAPMASPQTREMAKRLRNEPPGGEVEVSPPLGERGEIRIFLVRYLQGDVGNFYFWTRLFAGCDKGGVLQSCGSLDFRDLDDLRIADFPNRVTIKARGRSILIDAFPRLVRGRPDHSVTKIAFDPGAGFNVCYK